jgi:hypothetical protein
MSADPRAVHEPLERRIVLLQAQLTPALVRSAIETLLQQGEDPGGGISAFRLVDHLAGDPALNDTQVIRAYERLRPVLRAVLEGLPEFYYFEGD